MKKKKEINNFHKPRLVNLIAIIAIFISVSGISTILVFMAPSETGVSWMNLSEVGFKIILQVIISIGWLLAGIGMLRMRKWGLYIFSIMTLILIMNMLYDALSIQEVWLLFGPLGIVLTFLPMIYGVGGLIYLWKFKDYFKV